MSDTTIITTPNGSQWLPATSRDIVHCATCENEVDTPEEIASYPDGNCPQCSNPWTGVRAEELRNHCYGTISDWRSGFLRGLQIPDTMIKCNCTNKRFADGTPIHLEFARLWSCWRRRAWHGHPCKPADRWALLALASELPFRKKTSVLALGQASQPVCWEASVALSLAELVVKLLALAS
jgi:hypothetical protein